ncbi:amidohydrolase family protein [Paenibacillus beijingensis]|uniref:2-amino-3-carboxymuconate-6-semialdehyde decarboxylase n=1 Tax=Paenibacillus beijingensis TaxID=1126833 RepID=A0A0D5NJY6_9BACL|nr:amidohydrolase family protein [Paenibacillus beijingensis]AJY75581.1 2-amino-3-carboxymuconate-6-semialdehyde decarboxylase [Paenibacillus beijingensis]
MFKNSGFQVFDIHAHLPYRLALSNRQIHELVARYGKERSERMRLTWDFPAPDSSAADNTLPLIDRWAAELDKYNIGGLNFLTALDNDNLAEQIAKYPDRFTGFAYHSIENDNAAEELRRAVDELGLKGYKLFGPLTQTAFDDPALAPVWTFLAQRRLPVLIHFGMLGHAGGIVHHPNINPLSIFNTAREYPDIPFIIPHFGAGYFQELLHLCWSCPNVYIDTSGSNQWVRWMPYELNLEILFRKTYELIGPERIIFGTDASGFPRGYPYRYLQDQVRVCRELRFSETDIESIFGNNARRVLNFNAAPVSNALK